MSKTKAFWLAALLWVGIIVVGDGIYILLINTFGWHGGFTFILSFIVGFGLGWFAMGRAQTLYRRLTSSGDNTHVW